MDEVPGGIRDRRRDGELEQKGRLMAVGKGEEERRGERPTKERKIHPYTSIHDQLFHHRFE